MDRKTTAPPKYAEPAPDPDWRDRANCADADPNLFIESRPRGRVATAARKLTAVRYCLPCPVRRECGATADAYENAFGLYAGVYRTSSGERTDLLDAEWIEDVA